MRVAGRIAAQALAAAAAAHRARASRPTSSTASATSSCSTTAPTPRRSATAASPSRCARRVNEVICHGIPDDRPLEDGDIVNIDITAFIGRRARRHRRDLPRRRRRRGVAPARRAHPRGADARHQGVVARAARSTSSAGSSRRYAKRFGYGVVRDFTGHGVGARVPHRPRRSRTTTRPRLRHRHRAGHGVHHRADAHPRHARVGDVGRRLDRRHPGPPRTAQFEHTLLVTETGAEILTLP